MIEAADDNDDDDAGHVTGTSHHCDKQIAMI